MISIIIPAYNCEKFIDRAVQSVLCQQGIEYELLLVDDGSTDNTGKICDEYESNNSKIRAFHQDNRGLSAARNKGIVNAKGEYISFLDADDYVDSDTYGVIMGVIKSYSPDLIDFGWKYISDTNEITRNMHGIEKNILYDRDFIVRNVIPPLVNIVSDKKNFLFDFSVNKIYKTSIIMNNNILFDESRRIWEDRVFVVEYLKYCMSFYPLDYCFYNYVSVAGSLSRRYDLNFFRIILDNYNIYYHLYKDIYDFNTEYVKYYWSNTIQKMIERSLNEKENRMVIEHNISITLKNPLVKRWFKERRSKSEEDRRISIFVEEENINDVIKYYSRKNKLNNRTRIIGEKKYQIKKMLKSIIIK